MKSPPPLATMMTSTAGLSSSFWSAAMTSPTDLSPCTAACSTTNSTSGHRSFALVRTSFSASESFPVTNPMTPGRKGVSSSAPGQTGLHWRVGPSASRASRGFRQVRCGASRAHSCSVFPFDPPAGFDLSNDAVALVEPVRDSLLGATPDGDGYLRIGFGIGEFSVDISRRLAPLGDLGFHPHRTQAVDISTHQFREFLDRPGGLGGGVVGGVGHRFPG